MCGGGLMDGEESVFCSPRSDFTIDFRCACWFLNVVGVLRGRVSGFRLRLQKKSSYCMMLLMLLEL